MPLKNIQNLIIKGKLDIAQEEINILDENQKLRGKLLQCEIFDRMGKHEEALVLATQVLEECKKHTPCIEELGARVAQAYALIRVNKFDKTINIIKIGEELLEKFVEIIDYKNIRKYEATFKNLMGLVLRYQGNLSEAHKYYTISLNIRTELDLKREIAISTQNIATILLLKGELDESLKFNHRALKIFEEFADSQFIAYTFHDIALVHWTNGDLVIALNYLEKSQDMRRKLANPYNIIDTLYYLVLLNLELNQKEEAKSYLKELEEWDQKTHNSRNNVRYQLAKAMVLKSNDRIIQTAESQKIFYKISLDKTVDHELMVYAMLNLYELLIKELKSYKNEQIMAEVKNLSTRLINIAKEQDSHSLLAQTYLLQSKLALLELDVTQAQYLLTQAEITANEKNLHKLAMQISNEYDAIIDRTKWEELKKRNASLIERVEESQLNDILADMIKRHKEEKFETVDEIPVLLLILNQNGISVYSNNFNNKIQVSEQLIGGFLTASSAGMTQALSGIGSIERIKYGKNTMIFKNTTELTFCYIFQGKSYLAIQRLNNFIEQVKGSATRWKTLVAKVPKPKLIENLLLEFVMEIFPKDEK